VSEPQEDAGEVKPGAEAQLAPYMIERARSSRSKCKTCRKAIDKGLLRLGVLIEGPFGTGYIWHHLECAAKKQIAAVEEAYAGNFAVEGVELPPIEELRKLADESEKKKQEKQAVPFVERASTGRSKCAQCGEPIAQDAFRVAALRTVEFYGQVRAGPIKVHAECVSAALAEDNSATDAEGFADALRANSRLSASDVDAALATIGDLEQGEE
jgi:ribosomal protein L37AE/L43A